MNIQSFMGAIMAIGVAVANAILLVTFAERHRREEGADAGRGRRRGCSGPAPSDPDDQLRHDRRHGPDGPGLGEGGEQTAPLGTGCHRRPGRGDPGDLDRLPTVFAIIQNGAARGSASIDPFDPQSGDYFVADHGEQAAMARRTGQWCNRGRFLVELADRQENAGRYAAGRAGSCHLRLHKTVPGPDESYPGG